MKVAIVADAYGSRHLAPFDDPEWEIWGLGNSYIHIKRADKYFEIHPWWNILQHNDVSQEFAIRDDLGVKETLVHEDLLTYWPEDLRSPSFVRFPWEEVVARSGVRYMTSSIAWMLAYALTHVRPDELAVYGVEASLEEYKHERPCIDYWLGRLQQAGVKVTLPPYSNLLGPHRLYGFEMEQAIQDAGLYRTKYEQHQKEAEDATKKVVAARTACVFAEGRLRQLDEPKDREWVMEGYTQAQEIKKECEKALLESIVRLDETDHYIAEYTLAGDKSIRDGSAEKALNEWQAAHPAA